MSRLLILSSLLFVITSCAPPVKYSPAELNQFEPWVQEHIKKSEVTLGMPPAAVRYAWGAPDMVDVLKPDEQGRYREQWVYTKFKFYSTKLVFTEGKVTGIISGFSSGRQSAPQPPPPVEPKGEEKEGGSSEQ